MLNKHVFMHIKSNVVMMTEHVLMHIYEGWNFNSGNYLFTTDTK